MELPFSDTWLGVAIALLLALGVLGLRTLVQNWVEAGIDSRFARKLEEFRHGLELDAERIRFDYERRLRDFYLVAEARHEKYANLFEKILKADGRIRRLFGFKRALTLEDHDREDIAELMIANEVPSGKQTEILEILEQDRERGIEELRQYLRAMEPVRARRDWQVARNELLANELYVSDEVREQAEIVLGLLYDYLVSAELVIGHPWAAGDTKRPDKAEIREEIETLRDLMRGEITRGDYVPAKPPGSSV